ncbi:MAG: D-alanine--D-alanine ligase [Alphaproteobacteria bacterium]|nr:D-alanine--D-alanine ligase [Alphaproteobacteria bacterium]
MTRRILVLMGGISRERDVSLVSGAAVAKALAACGHEVRSYDVSRDVAGLVREIESFRPDAVFNALHGRYGEDGCVQGLLEMMGVPYTHSGVRASAIAMNKPATKSAVERAGVRTPRGMIVRREDFDHGDPMPRPFVVKPVDEGSTIGVKVVGEGDNRAWGDDWAFGAEALVEEYIGGRELTVGIMGERPLAVTEIRFDGQAFDYTAKYTAGHAEHVLPAPIPRPVYDAALDAALTAHRVLGCDGISRSDFRYDDRRPGTDGLYFLEINTQPGFTPLSLVPEQAQHLGIGFGTLCEWLIERARCHA